MNTKWILILGGLGVGYWYFKHQSDAAIAAVAAATPGAAPAQTSQAAAGTKALIQAAAQSDPAYKAGNGRMSANQWGYYYRAVRGSAAPAPESIGLDGSMLISLDEYWTAATAHGLSGLRAAPRRRSAAARAWGM